MLVLLAMSALLWPTDAAAQGSLTNGGNNTGAISAPGEIDEWTFTATSGDSIVVSISETLPGGPDPGFWPWIRLYNPAGTLVSGTSQYGDLAAQFSTTAGLTGTYTIRVATADAGNDALGAYVLRLAKVPGAFTVGDQGGALTNGGNHPGHIDVGDLDMWSFTANQNESAVISIGEVPVGSGVPDPGFWPWIRIYGPLGDYIGGSSQYGNLAAQATFVAPLTGTYTVIVSTADAANDAVGDYILRLAKIPGTFSDEDGGALANGGNHLGHIDIGDLDMWSFTAGQNETAVISIGEIPAGAGNPDPGFWPWIRVYNPLGAYVGGTSQYGDLAAQVSIVAPLAGTYTVIVSTADAANDAVGDYVLRLAKVPGAFTVPAGDHGGAMANGGNHPGRIEIGDLDMWTFTAGQDETAVISIGEVPVGSTDPDPGFWPWIRVYNPLGAYIGGTSQYGNLAAQVSVVAPLAGTYTVIVSTADAANDAVGDYILRVAKMPGPFTVPAGDHGGALANGGNHPGRIEIGDLDMWTFTAAQNDTAVVSIGEVPVGSTDPDPGFWPWIRIYDPLGAYIGGTSQYGNLAAQVSLVAPLAGTYTVVVSTADAANDATGDYVLRLAKMPGEFTVPPSDHGGAMTNGVDHPGRIEIGDLDMWSFSACTGASVVVTINEIPVPPTDPDPGFWPWIRVYNPAGTFVGGPYGDTLAQLTFAASRSGTFTVVAGTADSGNDATGDYTTRVQVTGGTCVGVPTTNADPSYSTPLNTALDVAAPGVLANDNSNGGGAMTAQLVTNVSTGTLALNANGSFTYTPPTGFTGSASFTYRAVNSAGPGNTATVTIGVGTAPLPTTIPDPGYTTPMGTLLTTPAPGVLGNDNSNGGGAMTAQLVTNVSAGALVLNADGSFAYTPPAGFTGSASFTYRAVNAAGPGNTATVTIAVTALVPTTVPDPGYATPMGTPLTTAAPGVLGNDLSNGGGALSAQLMTTTTNGILTLASDGSFSYTPNPGFHGPDSFTYHAVNSVGPGNTATATIAVQNITDPQPPTALYAASISGNTVTLRFTPPLAGPAPTGYIVAGGVVPNQELAALPTGSAYPIYTFVAPTGSFYVRVHTLAGAQRSAASNEIRIHVNVPVPPSAPAHLTGMANGSSIALVWRNTFEGGAPGGVILDVSGSLNASLSLGLTDNFQFNGVPGGSYTLSLRAANAAGNSPSSNAINLTFPSTLCSGAPQPPANFLAHRLGNTIHVLWDPAASGPAPTGFVLNVGGAFGGSFGTPGRSLSGTVGPGTYQLSVAAANACGASAATVAQTVVVP